MKYFYESNAKSIFQKYLNFPIIRLKYLMIFFLFKLNFHVHLSKLQKELNVDIGSRSFIFT